MMKRGQGAFEYILMLSGVLLIVILIIFILQGTLSGTNNTMSAQQNTYNTAVTADIVPQYTQYLVVTGNTGGINGELVTVTTAAAYTANTITGCGIPAPAVITGYTCNGAGITNTVSCCINRQAGGTGVCTTGAGQIDCTYTAANPICTSKLFDKTNNRCANRYPCCLKNGAAATADSTCNGQVAINIPDCYAPKGINCPTAKFDRKTGKCA